MHESKSSLGDKFMDYDDSTDVNSVINSFYMALFKAAMVCAAIMMV